MYGVAVLCAVKQPRGCINGISGYEIFDNSAVNILITKAVVTTDAHIVFHFIDGSTYNYRICGNTPLGQVNMNVRKEYHRKIAELYAQGVSQSTIAETLVIPINTVRSYIKRSLK